MGASKITASLLIVFLSSFILQPSSFSDLVAADNADNDDPYADAFDLGDNGGYGFLGWAELYEGDPASMYNTTQIGGGKRSWGLSGSYALGRGLSNSMSRGTWTLLARHDADNGGFSGFNLKTSTNITFEADEIFRFGDDPSQAAVELVVLAADPAISAVTA